MDNLHSERLNIIRFPLIIGVIFIHNYATSVQFAGGVEIGVNEASSFSIHLRNFISDGVARLAVPIFFLLSGYFLFLNTKLSWTIFLSKVKNRVKSLLVPFLFWNLFVLAFLAFAQNFDLTKQYFSSSKVLIKDFTVFDYLNAMFGLTTSPIAFQFWFIRDLMCLVLISPLIYFCLKSIPRIFLITLFLFFITETWHIYIPRINAIFFFSIGMYLAKRSNLFVFDNYGGKFILVYLIILTIDVFTKQFSFNYQIHNIGILVGIPAAIYLTKYVTNYTNSKNLFMWLATTSFFVFASHEPLLTIITKLTYVIIAPSSDIETLIIYFASPLITIAFSLLAYLILKRFLPQFTKIISGGR